jgi:hypothetical protein
MITQNCEFILKCCQGIIARYKEDISWTNDFDSLIDFIIYDKADLNSPFHLPNIPRFDCPAFRGSFHAKTPTGRESHTYLYHIIKHYPHFADLNLFCQARVKDHLPNFHSTLNYLLKFNGKINFFHFGNVEIKSLNAYLRLPRLLHLFFI